MENSERRVGRGHHQSEPRSPSLTKRKRTPATAGHGPSHASSSWEEVIYGGGGPREKEAEDVDSDEQPEESAAADEDEQQEEGKISLGHSDGNVLDCPICFEPLTVPVFQCGNGHVICSPCRDDVKQKCPSCFKKIGNVRCRAIESVLEAVKVHCSYKGNGCPVELSYSSKRSHQAACAYAPFGCPFDQCSFVGCQKRLSLHLNNTHASSVVRLRFGQPCPVSVSRAEKFVVLREEASGTLFILNKYDRMAVSCIDGSNVSVGDGFAYALVVRGKDSCLRFQSLTSRFESTPAGKGLTVCGPSKDFIQVPSYLFGYDGCLRLELCVWRKGTPCVDIATGGLGEA